jgi:glycine/D-amino acid oxidase-like deaminating enzyme
MNPSFWHGRNRSPEISFDIAVIGAGIVGSSAAYWISRLGPTKKVLLVDRGTVASGASGRNAGFLLQGATSDYTKDRNLLGPEKARRVWKFTRENRDLLFSELDPSSFDLESTGSMVVAGSPEEDTRLQECVPLLRSDGIAAIYFPPDMTSRRLHASAFYGSLYVPSGATLDPVALVRHVVDRSGAIVLENAPVQSIEMKAGVVHIETQDRPIKADRVLVCVNAWLRTLIPELSRYVRPVRAQMFASRPMAGRWLDVPIYSHDGFFYVRQSREGVILAGGARHLHEQEEVGYDDAVTDAVQRDVERYVRGYFHLTEDMQIALRWSGTMGFSPDHLPVVGGVPDIPGSYWAGGFTGHGMAYGFRFGKMLAEAVLDRRNLEGFDLFSASRFETRKAASGS